VAVLTVSDGVAAGEREDRSGPRIESWARDRGHAVVAASRVADRVDAIVPFLVEWCDGGEVDLVLTTGGTGLGPRDVTPEATRVVIEREAPGIAELLRREGQASTPFAALGRGVVGARARALVVNLPGSPTGVTEGLSVLDRIVEHAVTLLRGEPAGH
jgi:molybdenum cofactor synthesis domain-containing protein